MHTVDQITREIIAREGGFVDDPDDPGGATKYGVTIHTMRDLGLDLDRDGDVDSGDVRALTIEQAADIFKQHYFYKPRIHKLPEALWATVFDMQVNAGSNAIRILQRLIGEFGEPVTVDGVLGPLSIAAAQKAHQVAGDALINAYGIARRNYYFRIGDRRPASRKYCVTHTGRKGGWIRRAEEFISKTYAMTQEQFRDRIAAWG